MRVFPSPAARALCLTALLGFSISSFGLTLEEIRNIPDLNPAKLAAYFSDFEFKFRSEVQSPKVFLATRSGDCDDFSTLAASVLREKGFTPRLITVRMPGVVHVVCYVEETRSYLDYNNRGYRNRTVSSGPEIEAIAESVAKSYELEWTSASEFTYEDRAKRLVQTVLSSTKSDKIIAGVFR